MNGYLTLPLALVLVLNFHHVSSAAQCGFEESSPTALRLNIASRRNRTGKWVTEVHAFKDYSEIDEDNEMVVDVTHDVVDCSGRKKVVVRGKILGFQLPEGNVSGKSFDVEILRFHPKSGTNTAVINDGRTVEKIVMTESGYGSTFTNRPLKDDELFEVILEKKTNHFTSSLGIGVSPYSPVNMAIPKYIHFMPEPNWSYYHSHLYHNNGVTRSNYGMQLSTLGEGSRLGVMRRSTGVLHYFINGVDQGPAATDLPSQVYGIIELYGNAARVSIVKGS